MFCEILVRQPMQHELCRALLSCLIVKYNEIPQTSQDKCHGPSPVVASKPPQSLGRIVGPISHSSDAGHVVPGNGFVVRT